ncbi:hypothetical protein [uncultured Alistipes sp.]|uniref:hypothetical protein n=1 Tax=uncultured Alistipes sp. TaxID=538949 RepID=UPI002665E09B|nr:hypothetical protein [uncultured Alistipes sp.]
MTFTTPCFVRVEDAAERKKLIKWLEGIGYEYVNPPKEECHGYKVVCESSYCGTSHDEQTFATAEYIDAGTNVDLFRSLAAMNDENDRDQWFVVDDGFQEEMVCSKSDVDYDYILSSYNHRKATADDIVKYFKKREK